MTNDGTSSIFCDSLCFSILNFALVVFCLQILPICSYILLDHRHFSLKRTFLLLFTFSRKLSSQSHILSVDRGESISFMSEICRHPGIFDFIEAELQNKPQSNQVSNSKVHEPETTHPCTTHPCAAVEKMTSMASECQILHHTRTQTQYAMNMVAMLWSILVGPIPSTCTVFPNWVSISIHLLAIHLLSASSLPCFPMQSLQLCPHQSA